RILVLPQSWLGERLEAQPVDGVGGVGDQLAQEDLLVAVQRVDHQVQDLNDLGLEAEALLPCLMLCLRGHRTPAASSGMLLPGAAAASAVTLASPRCHSVIPAPPRSTRGSEPASAVITAQCRVVRRGGVVSRGGLRVAGVARAGWGGT